MQKPHGSTDAGYRSVRLSVGDIADRLTIARIKHRALLRNNRYNDAALVQESIVHLSLAIEDLLTSGSVEFDDLLLELERINERLWDVEDDCRDDYDLSTTFLEKARAVIRLNAERSLYKAKINAFVTQGSPLDEVKLYGKKTDTDTQVDTD